MTTDTAAQLAILANALTEIVDLATAGPKTVAPPGEVLARAGDIAAQALAVALRLTGACRRLPRPAKRRTRRRIPPGRGRRYGALTVYWP